MVMKTQVIYLGIYIIIISCLFHPLESFYSHLVMRSMMFFQWKSPGTSKDNPVAPRVSKMISAIPWSGRSVSVTWWNQKKTGSQVSLEIPSYDLISSSVLPESMFFFVKSPIDCLDFLIGLLLITWKNNWCFFPCKNLLFRPSLPKILGHHTRRTEIS